MPASISVIGDSAFYGCDFLVVIAPENSYALEYARINKLNRSILYSDYSTTESKIVDSDSSDKKSETVQNTSDGQTDEETNTTSNEMTDRLDDSDDNAGANSTAVSDGSGSETQKEFNEPSEDKDTPINTDDKTSENLKDTEDLPTTENLPVADEKDFKYETNSENGAVTITGYTGSAAKIRIPSVIDGKNVASIGEDAFWDDESLESVIIPDGVTDIGEGAFLFCNNLTSVYIPTGVKKIGRRAFSFCSKMVDIYIPDGVEEIGDGVFNACESLENIRIPESATKIGDNAFTSFVSGTVCTNIYYDPIPWLVKEQKKAENHLVIINGVLIDGTTCSGDVVVPDYVTSITADAFSHNTELTSIKIPDEVSRIGSGAFYYCENLKTVNIPTNISNIGYETFYMCSSISEIKIPESVNTIDVGAFCGCDSLQKVNIPDGVELIDMRVFDGCSSLKDIEIPDSVTCLGWLAFGNCGLTEITLPDSVTQIAMSAFGGCEDLEKVSMDSVTEIGEGAFGGCTSLKEITIPKGVLTIQDSTFSGCSSLADISFEGRVAYIGRKAFYDCTSLKSIDLPDSLTGIGEYAFSGTGLESIVIPASVNSLGGWYSYAFFNCVDLASVTFAEGTQAISGNYVFTGCTSLQNVNIPSSVTSVDKYTFISPVDGEYDEDDNYVSDTYEPIPWLKNLQNANPLVVINGILIDGSTCSGSVTIPEGVTKINSDAFYENQNITDVTIPSSMTSIGGEFQFMNLRSITIPETVTDIWFLDGAANAFRDDGDITIIAPEGSYAITYAMEYGFNYQILNATTAAPPTTEAASTTQAPAQTQPSAPAVKKIKIKSAVSKAVKGGLKITLKWKKLSGVSGYQIQVSSNKNFRKARTYSAGRSKKSFTTKKLKKGRTYYVRIRGYKSYKDSSGKKHRSYGKWKTIKASSGK